MIASKVARQDSQKLSTRLGEAGQTLIEFVLLLLVVMVLSTVMITGFRGGVKGFWKGAALILCNHGNTIKTQTNCGNINDI
tara:strand:+ start:368 stop:610 length:243 start_codon:yes stop_codon:yes gene_type:complete